MSDDDRNGDDLQAETPRDYETGAKQGTGLWGAIKGSFNRELKAQPRVFRGPGYGRNKIMGEGGRPGVDIGIGRIDRNGFRLPPAVTSIGNKIFGGLLMGQRVVDGVDNVSRNGLPIGRRGYDEPVYRGEPQQGRSYEDPRPNPGDPGYKGGYRSLDTKQPVVTRAPQTAAQLDGQENSYLARINDAQNKLNNGPASKLSDQDAVKLFSDKMKGENPGAYERYTQGGFAQTREGLNEFFNYSREVEQNPGMRQLDETFAKNPEIGRSVIEQWRLEAGKDSTSPDYKGRTTILTHLGKAAQDPDILDMMQRSPNPHEFWENVGGPYSANGKDQAAAVAPVTPAQSTIRAIDPDEAVGIKTPSGQVSVPKSDPSAAKFEPTKPTTQIAGVEFKSGQPLTTAILNQLSAQGIFAETRVGQNGDASTNLFVDRAGKVVGGYTTDKNGASQNMVSLEDLSKKLADMGKDVEGIEKGIQMARASKGQGSDVQVAATTAPAIDPSATKVNLDAPKPQQPSLAGPTQIV